MSFLPVGEREVGSEGRNFHVLKAQKSRPKAADLLVAGARTERCHTISVIVPI